MTYDIIFYISKKTGYCEKTLRKALAKISADAARVISTTSPTALGEEVMLTLRTRPLCVIIGGLSTLEDENLATVLSRALSTSTLTLSNLRKLETKAGVCGYIIRYQNQAILALPDEPALIEEMLGDTLLNYLDEKLNRPIEEAAEAEDAPVDSDEKETVSSAVEEKTDPSKAAEETRSDPNKQ